MAQRLAKKRTLQLGLLERRARVWRSVPLEARQQVVEMIRMLLQQHLAPVGERRGEEVDGDE